MNPGLLYAFAAFGIWGLFPLYLRELASVPPLEVVVHRSVWSLLLLLVVLTVMRRWAWLPALRREPRRWLVFVASALLLSVNWLVYVYAVVNGHVLDASLGYFINPLVSVLLGVLVLRERLQPAQWLAVALAAAGVLWLTIDSGRLPWVALILALSFGLYGLLRKTAPLGALEGLTLETIVLAPLVLPLLVWFTLQPGGAMARGDWTLNALLLLAGPLTALPLLLFAAAARRLPLATVGLMQYISPTVQFVLGITVFREPMQPARLIGFVFIWTALAVYSGHAWWASRQLAARLARAA
ncbi:MAG TPA: EamA family transporter RarD [Rubrivivax sp.]|nr:EamA family transporter RarD [Burkholderiales bacterium]HNT39370.1 EamA family transporter RarD [Rubrivivax sp.]